MFEQIGTILVCLALWLDSVSYYRQIAKTIRTKKSSQVSSSQFLYKIGKALCALVGLAIYENWVGVGIETFMIGVYIASLYVVAKYKPKNWRLFGGKNVSKRRSTQR